MTSPDFTAWSVILPAKDIRGVKGTATIHMITSEIAKFKMKKFVTECMLAFRTTTVMTGNWIRKLKILHFCFWWKKTQIIRNSYYSCIECNSDKCRVSKICFYTDVLRLKYYCKHFLLSDSCLKCFRKILNKIWWSIVAQTTSWQKFYPPSIVLHRCLLVLKKYLTIHCENILHS